MHVKKKYSGLARTWGLGVLLTAAGVAILTADTSPQKSDWPMFGHNASNTAFNSAENLITTRNVGTLKLKWAFTTSGDVSARPALVNNVAYFPDWAGKLWA